MHFGGDHAGSPNVLRAFSRHLVYWPQMDITYTHVQWFPGKKLRKRLVKPLHPTNGKLWHSSARKRLW